MLVIFFFLSCSDDQGVNVDYLRSPSDFRIRSFEAEGAPPGTFLLSWQNPSQETDYNVTYIVLDTNGWKKNGLRKSPKNSNVWLAFRPFVLAPDPKKEKHTTLKDSIKIEYKAHDSILIQLGSNLNVENGAIILDSIAHIATFLFDTTKGHMNSYYGDPDEPVDPADRQYYFALVCDYHDVSDGLPRFTSLPIFDNLKPWPLQIKQDEFDSTMFLSWYRPKDPTSFFYPEKDTGIIKAYGFILQDQKRKEDSLFRKLNTEELTLVYTINGTSTTYSDGGSSQLSELINAKDDSSETATIEFRLPDGRRFQNDKDSNYVSITLSGLIPEQKYLFQLFAIDSSENKAVSDAEKNTIIMTDTTKPAPITGLDSIPPEIHNSNKNSYAYVWDATHDTRVENAESNDNIKEYRMSRIYGSDMDNPATLDTIHYSIQPFEGRQAQKEIQTIFVWNDSTKTYRVDFFFLPPGTFHKGFLWAVDSSGYRSDTVSFSFAILKDNSACPPNFVHIDTSKTDDQGFCIERLEHQDSTGQFVTDVTIDEARIGCQLLEDSLTGSVHLCTEEEWMRSCQGDISAFKHSYGIQSIVEDSAFLDVNSDTLSTLRQCNHAAHDKEMAFDDELRDDQCTTNEGVFDLTGNLSEWVEAVQAGSSAPSKLLFKGGNYLAPSNEFINFASYDVCVNNSAPYQKRPDYDSNCISPMRMAGVIYGNASGQDSAQVCFSRDKAVIAASFNEDSTVLILTFDGGDDERIIVKKEINDSVSIKPSKVLYSDSAVYLVSAFVPDTLSGLDSLTFSFSSLSGSDNVIMDTLSYSLFLYSDVPLELETDMSLHPILKREVNDRWLIVPLQKLFGFDKLGVNPATARKPAKQYYSHETIGFRCCVSIKSEDD
ncbi:MAG: hypothetical protein HQK83_06055 [Fibrobacteria bacterium]|nr:hypothetical protein [Fibrobacteria bacterium]